MFVMIWMTGRLEVSVGLVAQMLHCGGGHCVTHLQPDPLWVGCLGVGWVYCQSN